VVIWCDVVFCSPYLRCGAAPHSSASGAPGALGVTVCDMPVPQAWFRLCVMVDELAGWGVFLAVIALALWWGWAWTGPPE
jgi:hypothetical protein